VALNHGWRTGRPITGRVVGSDRTRLIRENDGLPNDIRAIPNFFGQCVISVTVESPQEVNDGKKDTGSPEERRKNSASNDTGRDTTCWRASAGRTGMRRRSDLRLSLK